MIVHKSMSSTTTAAAGLLESVAKLIVAAFYDECFAIDQRIGKLSSRVGVHALHRGACDIHLSGTFLLSESLEIDQPNRLIFVNGHRDKVEWIQLGA